MDLKLTDFDVAMLFGLILLGRRYGDLQTSDWAGDLRDRIKSQMEGKPDEDKSD